MIQQLPDRWGSIPSDIDGDGPPPVQCISCSKWLRREDAIQCLPGVPNFVCLDCHYEDHADD